MKRRKQLPGGPADDRGAALLLVLVVVTVVALAGAALLTFSDTSIRTTVALRDQGAAAYAAEGAAQVAISELQNGSFPNKCATLTGDGLPLGSTSAFYPSAQSGSTGLNAYVSCTPDSTTGTAGVVSSANKPKDAIRTVSDLSQGWPLGQDYAGSNKLVKVANGNVVSTTYIHTGSNTLAVTGAGVKVQAAWPNIWWWPWPGCSGEPTQPACEPGATLDPSPSYPAPTDPVSPAPAPVCTSWHSRTYAAFRPGLYTDVNILNGAKKHGNKNECGNSDVVWFSPGTYYFDFNGTWDAPDRLVGGTPTDSSNTPITGLDPTNASTLFKLSQLNAASTGACANPREGSPAPGVEFVFGGSSNVEVGSNKLEICATYSAGSVPIAIYGPTANIPVSGGGGSVSKQDVCSSDTCSMFRTDSYGPAEFHIQGFTYAPNARIALDVDNSLGQMFNWGLLLRSFSLNVNGASPAEAFVELPPANSVMYLSVWACPAAASPCDHSGPARLRAKVQVVPTAPVEVLSWSVQR